MNGRHPVIYTEVLTPGATEAEDEITVFVNGLDISEQSSLSIPKIAWMTQLSYVQIARIEGVADDEDGDGSVL